MIFDRSTINQINHILIASKHFTTFLDVINRRKANIDSDRYLLEPKIRAKISNTKKERGNKRERYNIDKLKNIEKAAKYREQLERQLDQAHHSIQINDINGSWGRCKEI